MVGTPKDKRRAHFTEAPATMSAKVSGRKAHPELGSVMWQRGFDETLKKANAQNKPLFVLFDEVPGCHTVQGYSEAVLNHPAIVDVLENEFVPLYVQNNADATSDDTRVLKSFNEPSWNNPVARVVSRSGKSEARLANDYSLLGTARFLQQSLKSRGKRVPAYLKLVIEEEENKLQKLSRVRLSMYCFWSGEVAIGAVDGVASTKPGHLGGKEVVEVFFNSKRISFTDLLLAVKQKGLKFEVFADNQEQLEAARAVGFSATLNKKKMRHADSDDKYQLKNSRYKRVEMSELQRMKVNADLPSHRNPLRWLAPSQRKN